MKYLAALDYAALGAAHPAHPKYISKSDPAAQWTRAEESRPYFAYANNSLINPKSFVMEASLARVLM